MKTLIFFSLLFSFSSFAQSYEVVETAPAREETIGYFCKTVSKHFVEKKQSIDMAACLGSGKQVDFVEGQNYTNAIVSGQILSEGKELHCSWFVRPTVKEALEGKSPKVICE